MALQKTIGTDQHDDFNTFANTLKKTLKTVGVKLDAKDKTAANQTQLVAKAQNDVTQAQTANTTANANAPSSRARVAPTADLRDQLGIDAFPSNDGV